MAQEEQDFQAAGTPDGGSGPVETPNFPVFSGGA